MEIKAAIYLPRAINEFKVIVGLSQVKSLILTWWDYEKSQMLGRGPRLRSFISQFGNQLTD